jgi:hypothetical protein
MIARNVPFSTFMRRSDHWLLLRAPLLWRTRLLHFLVLLGLAAIVSILFAQTRLKSADAVSDAILYTMLYWWSWLSIAPIVVILWIKFIIRKTVGELTPQRHATTVIAVAIGSYLYFISPSWVADLRIKAIERFEISDEQLNADRAVLYKYNEWTCVPPDAWSNSAELNQLWDVFSHYGRAVYPQMGDINPSCRPKEQVFYRLLDYSSSAYDKYIVEGIMEARNPYVNGFGYYDVIRINHFWWLTVAFLIGIMTALLSYPSYVWRRTLLRR